MNREIIDKCYEDFRRENRHHKNPTKDEVIVWLAQKQQKNIPTNFFIGKDVLPGSLPTDADIERYAKERTLDRVVRPEKVGHIGLIKIGMEIGMKTMRDMVAKQLKQSLNDR